MTTKLRLYNRRTEQEIAGSVLLADTFWLRLRGLLGRPPLKPGEGIWLMPCRQVHMHGMRYPLSVWSLDRQGEVRAIIDHLMPGKISPRFKDAYSVLEFPAGWAEKTGTKVGDILQSEK